MPTRPELFTHHPAPRADGRLPVTIRHLELSAADWKRRGSPPDPPISLVRAPTPTAALYRDLYDRVGRPWLWYERRLLSDAALAELLGAPGHELHVARDGSKLVGYFELDGEEIVFFGLTLPYVRRHIGPWLLDRAIERGFARGARRLVLNTNSLDHPRALSTYRKAGFHVVRSETKELQDPRVAWPELYRWPPA
jgi:ribosomal protein S18 acetylase RimI-like enzyme